VCVRVCGVCVGECVVCVCVCRNLIVSNKEGHIVILGVFHIIQVNSQR